MKEFEEALKGLHRWPKSVSWGQFHQHFKCSFYVHRSQSSKKYSQVVSFFALLGSEQVKDACKMLVKSTPEYMQRGQDLKHSVISSLCTLEWWRGNHTAQVMHSHPLRKAEMWVKAHKWS